MGRQGSAIYKRSGDSFTFLTSKSGFRTFALAFSPDSTYLAAGYVGSPYLKLWKRTSDAFDDTTATIDTAPTKLIQHIAWSSDSKYVSCLYSDTPWVYMLKRSGDSFTKLTQSYTSDISSNCNQSVFTQNGDYLIIKFYNASPYILIYKRDGDTFVKLPTIVTAPAGQVQWMDAAKGGNQYFALSITTSPYLTIYKNWKSAPVPMIL